MRSMDLPLMLIRAVPALVLVFLIWPVLLGAGLGLKKNIDRYIVGFAASQALFFVVYIPAVLFSWSSRTLVYTAVGVITLVGAAGAFIRYRKASDHREFLSLKKPDMKFLSNPFFWGFVLIAAYEMWTYAVKEPYIYGDDVTYVRLITSFVDTNEIYVKSWTGQMTSVPLSDVDIKYLVTSYYPFLGMISILTGLHPLVLCKTVLPLVYIPVHYLIVWRIASYLFDGEETGVRVRKQSSFMFIYAVLIEFGQISYYTLSRRVTIWIYNSKSDCFCLLLIPLFFYAYYLFLGKEREYKRIHGFFLLFVISLAAISASIMGLILSAVIVVLWGVITVVRLRKPSMIPGYMCVLIPHIAAGLLILERFYPVL